MSPYNDPAVSAGEIAEYLYSLNSQTMNNQSNAALGQLHEEGQADGTPFSNSAEAVLGLPKIQDPKAASTSYQENLQPPVPPPGICAGRDFWQGCFRRHCDCWYEAGCPNSRPA